MKVLVRGPLLSMSGYGNHAREVYRWLKSRNAETKTQILPWGITPWHINPDSLNGMIKDIMEESVGGPPQSKVEYDASFQIQLPNEWDPNLAKFNVGVTAAVETDRSNPAWVQNCNQMDLIVVPSEHTKSSLLNAGSINTKIVVVPESFVDSIAEKELPQFDVNVRTNFNFLLFGQLTGNNAYVDRKNTFFTLKWILEEFNGESDVGVILKTNNGRHTSMDRKGCENIIRAVKSEIKSTVPVYFLHGAMTNDEVAALYRNDKVKALVSATRGEGFGLPMLEASASGLPVIATNWSAHSEFLNRGKWINFDYDLVDIPAGRVDQNIFIEGSKWADVKEDDFKIKLRKFYARPHKPKEWATELSAKILENYSFSKVSRIWDDISNEHIGW